MLLIDQLQLVILMDEAIQDGDQVFWVLEVVLDVDVDAYSCSLILKDTIEMGEAVADQDFVTLNVLDHLEKPSNNGLSLLLLLLILKMRLDLFF